MDNDLARWPNLTIPEHDEPCCAYEEPTRGTGRPALRQASASCWRNAMFSDPLPPTGLVHSWRAAVPQR